MLDCLWRIAILNYLRMDGRRAKLNLKAQEEPKNEEEDEEEAFATFSPSPFCYFFFVFLLCFFLFDVWPMPCIPTQSNSLIISSKSCLLVSLVCWCDLLAGSRATGQVTAKIARVNACGQGRTKQGWRRQVIRCLSCNMDRNVRLESSCHFIVDIHCRRPVVNQPGFSPNIFYFSIELY